MNPQGLYKVPDGAIAIETTYKQAPAAYRIDQVQVVLVCFVDKLVDGVEVQRFVGEAKGRQEIAQHLEALPTAIVVGAGVEVDVARVPSAPRRWVPSGIQQCEAILDLEAHGERGSA